MRHRPFGQVVVGGLTAIVHALSFLCPWNAVGIPTGDRHHMWTAAVSTDGTGGSWVSMARQTNSTAAAADHQEHDGPGGGLWAAVHSYKVGPFCRCGVKDNCPLCCQCAGENMTEVPKELPSSLQTLKLEASPINSLSKSSMESYQNLSDLSLLSLRHLDYIDPDVFSGMNRLQTVYISQATSLKEISNEVFSNTIPELRSLWIIHSGLTCIPTVNQTDTKEIVSMVNFDFNRIERVHRGAFQLRTASLSLQYNRIREVDKMAFSNSTIGKLSLKGNKDLTTLHRDAFEGLNLLVELDLSETSITSLPADHFASLGLTKLWLKNTATLKVFPPVYNFQSIKEARLTYSYHCCAFRFPTTHNPEAYAKWMEEQQRACARTTSTQKSEQSPTVSGVRRRRTAVADWQLWKEARRHRRSYAVLRDEDGGGGPGTTEPSPLDPWWGHFHVPEGEVGSQPKDSPTLSLSRDTMGSAAPTSSHEYAEGFEDSIHPGGGSKDVGPQNEQELGRFLASTVDPPESKKEHCGNFSKNYREVVCYPEPDAFNPCEDVMGNVGLRIAVWFVVVAAVLGNLAVMVVLMSSRFKMTVSKFLMCNLAFADFCMGVYLFIIACMDLHTIGEYFNYAIFWQEGPGCQMAGFLTVFASELSIFTLTVITMERWFAITYAIHLNKRLRLGVAARVMVLGWMFALTLAALPLFGASSYSKTSICLPFEKSDVTDVAYLLTLLAINGLAFILICIFYGKMYWSISGHNSTVTQSDKTVAKRMALLVFTDFACWAPIAFFGLTAVAGYPLINVTNSKILLVFFYPLNSCANPFLYAIFTKQYRRDLLVIMNRFGLIASGQAEGKFKTTYSANLPYGGGRRTTTPCPDDRCRFHRHGSSTLTQVSSLDNSRHSNKRKSCSSADVTTTPTGTPPSPIKRRSRENGCCGLMCDEENCNGGGGDRKASTDTSSRRLSVVRENSHTSEEEMPSEKSSEAAMTAAMGGRTTAPAISPKHRGSPHPIKNSYMKLSSSSEHELILRKLAAANSSSTSPRSSGKWTGRRKSSAEVIPLRHHQNIDKIFI